MRTHLSILARILITILIPILISCNTFGVKQIKNEPNDSLFVKASFEKVSIEGKGRFRVYIRQTDQDGYKIEAEPEQLESLNVSDEGNRLKITGDKKLENYRNEITVYIHVKDLKEIATATVCRIQFENTITGESLSIDATGVNNVKGTLIVKKLVINDAGVNNFNLKGKTEKLVLNKSGVGSFNALDLEAQEGRIDISGVGKASVNIVKSAEFYSSGIAKISYKGNPVIKRSEKSGLAIIRKL